MEGNWVVMYNGQPFEAPGNFTPEQIKAALADVYPAVANAQMVVNEERKVIAFVVQAGTKGV